jgi:predicted PurR-regulated permease PerM
MQQEQENLSVKNQKWITASLILIAVVVLLLALRTWADFFIPLAFSALFWYLIVLLTNHFQKIKFAGKQMPYGWALGLGILSFFFIIWIMVAVTVSSIGSFFEELPYIQQQLLVSAEETTKTVSEITKLKMPDLAAALSRIDFYGLIKGLFDVFGSLVNWATFLGSYMLFLLIQYRFFPKKIDSIFEKDPTKAMLVKRMIRNIDINLRKYINVGIIINSITSVFVYVTLILFGVDYAAMWAILAFVLSFIPFIGSIIAPIMPALYAWAQFGSFDMGLMVGLIQGAIQFISGNIVTPRMMGKTVNLSSFVLVTGIFFSSHIWGFAGAFLVTPILVVLVIIFAHFRSTLWVAVLLSEQGDIDFTKPELYNDSEDRKE